MAFRAMGFSAIDAIAVANHIVAIFRLRPPSEIFQAVIITNVVPVTSDVAFRAGTDKSLKNDGVNSFPSRFAASRHCYP